MKRDGEFYVGQKFRVKQGYKPTQSAQWLETGDIVYVAGIYRYVILVIRPYGYAPNGFLKECFCKANYKQHLEEVK